MHYQDIQSSYPSVQLDKNNLYPIGTPIIEVHDPVYYPCVFHPKDPLFTTTGTHRCKENLERRKLVMEHPSRKSIVKIVSPPNLHDYIQSFFGFLVVDIIPNAERYHQTIQVHDGQRIMPTCRKVFKYPVFSEMLKYEISKGAMVTKIYRADRYKSSPSPWNGGPLSILYKCKVISCVITFATLTSFLRNHKGKFANAPRCSTVKLLHQKTTHASQKQCLNLV